MLVNYETDRELEVWDIFQGLKSNFKSLKIFSKFCWLVGLKLVTCEVRLPSVEFLVTLKKGS